LTVKDLYLLCASFLLLMLMLSSRELSHQLLDWLLSGKAGLGNENATAAG
jgi:hypothetical protein